MLGAKRRKLQFLSHKRKEDKGGEEENVMMEKVCIEDLAWTLAGRFERVIRQEESERAWKRELKTVECVWRQEGAKESPLQPPAEKLTEEEEATEHVSAPLNGKCSAS